MPCGATDLLPARLCPRATHRRPTRRTGLFDGVVTLAATLLGFGQSSDAGSAALQAGLGGACMALLSGGRASPGGLLELSPKVGLGFRFCEVCLVFQGLALVAVQDHLDGRE